VSADPSLDPALLLTAEKTGELNGSATVTRLAPMPRHIAIIMDGNGRWAQKRGLPRMAGHRHGADAVRATVRSARELGLEALTLYAFSHENWSRPLEEVRALMDLLSEYLVSERSEILDNQIRLRAIGQIDRLPGSVTGLLYGLMEESRHHRGMTLTLALSYGGREELVRAARGLVEQACKGELRPEQVTEEAFGARMPDADIAEPDLLIRTSGEARISNFLLWQLAYTELYFTETLWPDFDREELLIAIRDYQRRQRRFGLTGDQVLAL
jgi:undecaprenyl diphosphate synthase